MGPKRHQPTRSTQLRRTKGNPRYDARIRPLDLQSRKGVTGLDPYTDWLIRRKAGQLAGRYGFRPDDLHDLQQELALQVLLRLSKFDPAKASLRTFLSRIVDNAAASLVSHQCAECRDYRSVVLSLDEILDADSDETMERHEVVSDELHRRILNRPDPDDPWRMALQIDMDRCLGALPPHLRGMCEVLALSSVTETARQLGVSRTTVHRWIREAASELRRTTRILEYLGGSATNSKQRR